MVRIFFIFLQSLFLSISSFGFFNNSNAIFFKNDLSIKKDEYIFKKDKTIRKYSNGIKEIKENNNLLLANNLYKSKYTIGLSDEDFVALQSNILLGQLKFEFEQTIFELNGKVHEIKDNVELEISTFDKTKFQIKSEDFYLQDILFFTAVPFVELSLNEKNKTLDLLLYKENVGKPTDSAISFYILCNKIINIFKNIELVFYIPDFIHENEYYEYDLEYDLSKQGIDFIKENIVLILNDLDDRILNYYNLIDCESNYFNNLYNLNDDLKVRMFFNLEFNDKYNITHLKKYSKSQILILNFHQFVDLNEINFPSEIEIYEDEDPYIEFKKQNIVYSNFLDKNFIYSYSLNKDIMYLNSQNSNIQNQLFEIFVSYKNHKFKKQNLSDLNLLTNIGEINYFNNEEVNRNNIFLIFKSLNYNYFNNEDILNYNFLFLNNSLILEAKKINRIYEGELLLIYNIKNEISKEDNSEQKDNKNNRNVIIISSLLPIALLLTIFFIFYIRNKRKK